MYVGIHVKNPNVILVRF